jgi:hypothetical protein
MPVSRGPMLLVVVVAGSADSGLNGVVGWAVVVVVGGVDSCNGVETRSEAIRVFVIACLFLRLTVFSSLIVCLVVLLCSSSFVDRIPWINDCSDLIFLGAPIF